VESPAQQRIRRPVIARAAQPLAVMAVMWTFLLVWPPAGARQGDVLRFNQIAHGGTPYVDQQVEYPPLETLVILAVGSLGIGGTAVLVAIVNAVATIGSWLLLRRHWSPEVGRMFLWFLVPLQIFMPFRLDGVPLVLTVAAIALADRGREWEGGVAWGAAILFKVWPVFLLPMLLLRRRSRALLVAVGTALIGAAVWVATSGSDAVRQVESFRGATGWHIESVYGIVDSLVTDGAVRVEAGATRIGVTAGWEIVLLRGLTLAAIAAAWILARRRPIDSAGGPALAAITSLLLLSPVASPQYVAWLLPWAAIVATERDGWDVRILAVGASVSAAAVFAVYWENQYALHELLALASARFLCLVGLAVIGFTHRSVGRTARTIHDSTAPLQPAFDLPDG
jgi:hypothetical protein